MTASPLAGEIKNYTLDAVGSKAMTLAAQELRAQLRLQELKPEIFLGIQQRVLDLMKTPKALALDPLVRLRALVQGLMKAFTTKRMLETEGARVTATSAVLFFPRGKLEQHEVARLVAAELILTKVNLETEMVQVAQGIGQAYSTLAGLSSLLPDALNPENSHLARIFHEFNAGIWAGTMAATGNSTAHGNTNVEQFQLASHLYLEELLKRATGISLLGGA